MECAETGVVTKHGQSRAQQAVHVSHGGPESSKKPRREAMAGYAGSLMLHGVVTLVLSLILLDPIVGERTMALVLDQNDVASVEFDQPLQSVQVLATARSEPRNDHVKKNVERARVVVDRGVENSVLSWAEQFDAEEPAFGAAGFLKVPAKGRVVKRGSFAAWTVPLDPEPEKEYTIVIQVKLPATLRRYRASDLSGIVQGSDRYVQTIPWDGRWPNVTLTVRGGRLVVVKKKDHLPVRNGIAQLMIRVPPAEKLVRDTIRIRSRLLKEEQTLEIVF